MSFLIKYAKQFSYILNNRQIQFICCEITKTKNFVNSSSLSSGLDPSPRGQLSA